MHGSILAQDSGSPTLPYGAYLYPISLVFNRCHRFAERQKGMGETVSMTNTVSLT